MSEHKQVVTAELLIVLAFIEARRLKTDSPAWCRKHFVGKARRLLGRQLPENVLPISEESAAYFEPQRDAQMALKSLCVRDVGAAR